MSWAARTEQQAPADRWSSILSRRGGGARRGRRVAGGVFRRLLLRSLELAQDARHVRLLLRREKLRADLRLHLVERLLGAALHHVGRRADDEVAVRLALAGELARVGIRLVDLHERRELVRRKREGRLLERLVDLALLRGERLVGRARVDRPG